MGQIEEVVGCSLQSLFSEEPNLKAALSAVSSTYAFKLRSRASHVYAEVSATSEIHLYQGSTDTLPNIRNRSMQNVS